MPGNVTGTSRCHDDNGAAARAGLFRALARALRCIITNRRIAMHRWTWTSGPVLCDARSTSRVAAASRAIGFRAARRADQVAGRLGSLLLVVVFRLSVSRNYITLCSIP